MADQTTEAMTETTPPPTVDLFPGRPRTVSDENPTSAIPSAPADQVSAAPPAPVVAPKREADRAADRTARAARLEKARADLKKAQARLQAIEARERSLHRKADSRRKIIFGGLLIEAALQDPVWAERLAELQGRIVRERDLKSFEGWSLESERRNG